MAARARIQQLRAQAAEWSTQNPVLRAGEIGVELDTGFMKVGNGVAPWNARPYQGKGPQGEPGVDGVDGVDGIDGTNGTNAVTTKSTSQIAGAVTTPASATMTVLSGLAGAAGAGHTIANDGIVVPAGTYLIQGMVEWNVASTTVVRGAYLQTVEGTATLLYGTTNTAPDLLRDYGALVVFAAPAKVQLCAYVVTTTATSRALKTDGNNRLIVRAL